MDDDESDSFLNEPTSDMMMLPAGADEDWALSPTPMSMTAANISMSRGNQPVMNTAASVLFLLAAAREALMSAGLPGVHVIDVLGQGTYGVVYKALWGSMKVGAGCANAVAYAITYARRLPVFLVQPLSSNSAYAAATVHLYLLFFVCAQDTVSVVVTDL